jgi:exopolyphosphatase / guanosine-5'-triphosphate,3'-diphosphate pyrophosphatase
VVLPDSKSAPVVDPAEVLAAVDLGSNSFHMVVARTQHGHPSIVDRLREMVRLASGLDENGYLDDASQERALNCLRRFGQRLRDMHAHQVRVVGTNTLRRARNADVFLAKAEEALGHPVEVISGMEEARLIYLGVSHHIDSKDGRNMVVDIGGGSTELIVGEGYEPKHLESLYIGCVGLSKEHFEDGKLSQKRFDRARLAARLELTPVAAVFRRYGWARAVGSSGTVRAAHDVAHGLKLVDSGISLSALETIIAQLIAARRIEDAKLPGLGADRAPVFAGGVAILAEVMSALKIDHLQISGGALREGLLYDMLGRMQDEDARERSIQAMQRRYHVDIEQAQRVEATAAVLLGQVARHWQLSDERYLQLLVWAARLHEVGLDIAHARYHHHGGYLLANSDLPGFARLEQRLLAALVTLHRRKLDDPFVDELPTEWRVPAFRLIVLLRLAVLLNRTRSPSDLPPMALQAGKDSLELRFPSGWLDVNPLTAADLEQERDWLRARGFELRVAGATA